MGAAGATPPVWVRLTSFSLALLGLAVSAYLTYEHYTAATTLACPETGAINCVKVTTSTYSHLFGAPVALLGLLFFAVVSVACLPAAWRSTNPWAGRTRLAVIAGGVGFVVYLVWVELFRLDAICLWCTVVHVITVVLFAVVILSMALYPPDPV